ncbi:MAG: Tim44 domain-containing protein [Alphaproteobacteria bacterium]|nr:Tim44 domain-containing protein [Alphaproteobacteria bacterium]MCB9696495.1 Tim44 domain-containing protein [Alphaproteobacteria bacterium]
MSRNDLAELPILRDLPSPARETALGATVLALTAATGIGAITDSPWVLHLGSIAVVAGVIGGWVWLWRNHARPAAPVHLEDPDRALIVAHHASPATLGWAARLAARDPSFSLPHLLGVLRHLVGDGVHGVPMVRHVDLPERGDLIVRAVVPGEQGWTRITASGGSIATLALVSSEPCEPVTDTIAPDPDVAAARRALLAREPTFDADDFVAIAHRVSDAVDDGDLSVADELGRADLAWWRTRSLPAAGDEVTWLDARVDGHDERVELRCGDRVLSLRRRVGELASPWLLWRLRSAVPLALLAVLLGGLLLADDDAWARVGGGQSYSRRSSGGGGSGGGDDFGLILLLLRLVIDFPQLGIPLVLVAIGFFVFRSMAMRQGAPTVRTHGARAATGGRPIRATPAAAIPGLADLRREDAGFSTTVLLDYVVLVHRRALEAVGNHRWEVLEPFVSSTAAKRLTGQHPGVTAIDEVVAGGVRVLKVERHEQEHHLFVRVDSTRLEHRGEQSLRVHVEETLVFRRAVGVESLEPEKALALACPSCGAPIEVDPMGACRQCGTPITRGQLQWQLVFVERRFHRKAEEPDFGWTSGGDEPSVAVPIVEAGDLQQRLAELRTRHPDVSLGRFEERVRTIYRELQSAWSEARWERARPFCTDRVFQNLRFWMDGYAKKGVRNALSDVQLHQLRLVKVEIDRWHLSISVRLWGSMIDTIVDREGKVIGGSPKVARGFSEVWTFVRSVEARAPSSEGTALQCPSCGAPLDKVDETGVCHYCDAKITTGTYDWVLARIEQPEAWAG